MNNYKKGFYYLAIAFLFANIGCSYFTNKQENNCHKYTENSDENSLIIDAPDTVSEGDVLTKIYFDDKNVNVLWAYSNCDYSNYSCIDSNYFNETCKIDYYLEDDTIKIAIRTEGISFYQCPDKITILYEKNGKFFVTNTTYSFWIRLNKNLNINPASSIDIKAKGGKFDFG